MEATGAYRDACERAVSAVMDDCNHAREGCLLMYEKFRFDGENRWLPSVVDVYEEGCKS